MRLVGIIAAAVALAVVAARGGYALVVRRRSPGGRPTLRAARPGAEPRRPSRGAGRRSVVPVGARPEPGDESCLRLGHTGLSWCEEMERVRWGVRRFRIVAAVCGDCQRPQTEVRIVYPDAYTVPVVRPNDGQPTAPAATR